MKRKFEKKSLFKKIVAMLCTMAVLLSLSVPYNVWAAGKDVTSIKLIYAETYSDDEETWGVGLPGQGDLFNGDTYTIGKVSVTVSETQENGNTVLTLTPAGGNFNGVSTFDLEVYASYLPQITTNANTTITTTPESDGETYTATISLRSVKQSVYELTIGPAPAPEYSVDFDVSDDYYSFTEITVGGEALDIDDAPFSIKEGDTLNFTVEAQPGYKITRVSNNNTKIGSAAGSYSVKVTSDIYITVATSNAQYTISGLESPEEGYEILGNKIIGGKTTVGYGENYTFTVTTPAGKEDATVAVDGGARATFYNGQWIISNITKDITVTIKAGNTKTYTVTMPDETIGYSIVNAPESIAHGSSYTFDIKLDGKYNQSIPKVTATNGTVTTVKSESAIDTYTCTITGITENTTVSVTGVTRNPFVISGLDNGNGYTVIGTSKIEDGKTTTKDSSYTFYVRATDGFGNPEVSIAGGDAVIINLSDGQYLINGITDDVTVTIKAGNTKTYTVTMPDETIGYSIVNAPESIAHGSSCTFELKIDAKYDQSTPKVTATNGTVSFDKKVGNADKTVTYTYRLAGVTENTTISVTGITRNPYVISGLNSGEGYTVSASSIISEDGTVTTKNDSYTFYVKAADGYGTPSVRIASGDAVIANPSEGTYIINSITDDVTVEIIAGAIKSYNVIFPEVTGCTFEHEDKPVAHNGSYQFKINLADAYSKSADTLVVKANNVTLTAENGVYTINSVTSDVNITVTGITLNTYVISGLANSADGSYRVQGTFDENGTAQVSHGGSYSFYVYASDGFKEPTVTANGKPCIKNGNQYIIENVTADTAVTIKAGDTISYDVTLNKTEGCNFVTASGDEITSSVTVNHGGSYEFKLDAVLGYDISNAVVQVDGRNVTPDENGIYTIDNITANIIVSVSGVTKSVCKVTMNQEDGYTITASSLSVYYGDDFHFTVALDAGYKLVDVTVNGEKLDNAQVGMNTITGVTSDVVIDVNVEKITYSVSVNEGEFKTQDLVNTVVYGDSVSFTVTPNSYYKITRVTVNGTEYFADGDGIYTVANVTTDLNINVTTTPVTITINYIGGQWADNKTVTYAYDGKSSIDMTQLEKFVSSQELYSFDTWSMADGALDFDPDADKTVELIAQWKDNREFIRENIVLATSHDALPQNKVAIRTYINIDNLEYNLEFQGAKILAYGTLVAIGDVKDDEIYDMKDKLMNGQYLLGNEDGTGLQVERFRDGDGTKENSNIIVNYYHNDVVVDPLKMGKNNFIKLTIDAEIEAETIASYKALGWIMLQIKGETVIVFSDSWDRDFTQTTLRPETPPDQIVE